MRTLGALLLLISASTLAATPAADIVLTERTAYDGAVTISVPEAFTVMSDEMIRAKYPDSETPEVVYTNASGDVNLALSLPVPEMAPEQLADAHAALESALKGAYPGAKWFRSEVFERDGRRFFVLDLMTPAVDTEIRNVIMGTPFRGRLLVITFNVSRELAPTWIETGQKMLASIRIKS